MTGAFEPEVHILRDESTPDGVRGKLRVAGLEIESHEEEWQENRPSISCIPAGRYRLKLVRRPPEKGGYLTYEVMAVPGRSLIRIHPGISEEDSEGCILPGMRREMVRVKVDEDTKQRNALKRGVSGSKIAFDQFMAAMQGAAFGWITIEWAVGVGPSSH